MILKFHNGNILSEKMINIRVYDKNNWINDNNYF